MVVGPFPMSASRFSFLLDRLYHAGDEVSGVRSHLRPLRYHGFDAFRIFVGEVVLFGSILGDVVELPGAGLETYDFPVAVAEAAIILEMEEDGFFSRHPLSCE